MSDATDFIETTYNQVNVRNARSQKDMDRLSEIYDKIMGLSQPEAEKIIAFFQSLNDAKNLDKTCRRSAFISLATKAKAGLFLG